MYTWSGPDMIAKLKGLQGVRKVTIATAFFSEYGLELLSEIVSSNRVSPENVKIYLSMEFSDRDPAGLLERLSKIAKPSIVIRMKLHAKVFLFEGKENLLLTGSSNLTKGGFGDNLEMNVLTTEPDFYKLQAFFGKCSGLATPVNDAILEAYQSTESERQEARRKQNSLRDKLNAAITHDAFSEDQYPNINQQYFSFRDYETLFKKNIKRRDAEIARRRREIQTKLLGVNALVQKPMQAMGLAHHWSDNHITSTIDPNKFNRERVEWCGVRYTRKDTVQYIRETKRLGDSEDGFGFQKFACLQFCIISSGFEINLFHAVRNSAVDRNQFQNAILDKAVRAAVEDEIEKAQGHGFIWYAGDGEFPIDERDPGEFIKWYRENDREGAETYLAYKFAPDSPILENEQTIADAFIEYAKILTPLFDKVSHAWGKPIK